MTKTRTKIIGGASFAAFAAAAALALAPAAPAGAGANVLQGDGSVRFIRDSVDLSALAALSSRSGGEVIVGD
jgi:hypothetical protein